jgi:hypothetical protein
METRKWVAIAALVVFAAIALLLVWASLPNTIEPMYL